jgi:pyruvate dehydrogenase E2 component (dihydrolipoamide acetyltransferase)
MPSEIVMPQLGLTMTEGSVNAWIKQAGEHVRKGEMLFTVSTDKVDMEVESTGSGFLQTVVEVGATVPVGTVIAVLTDKPGESTSVAHAATANRHSKPSAQAPEVVPTAITLVREGRGYPASPRARSLAKHLGIDVSDISPESGNRIVEADVKRFAERQKPPSPSPVSAVKRITAERTTQSFERAPHFYLGREVNATRLVELRQTLQATAQRKLGFNLSYTDFLLRAMAIALREETSANAYWENGELHSRTAIDLALAVQTDSGLLVPVLAGADQLTLFAIAERRKDLSDRARSGKLRMEEMQGGSATLSNLGSHGVDWFQAILNPPQSVILAAGSIQKRPIVKEGRLEVADTLILSLSVDHRVLDGVAGARFLSAIARTIEDPFELIV